MLFAELDCSGGWVGSHDQIIPITAERVKSQNLLKKKSYHFQNSQHVFFF